MDETFGGKLRPVTVDDLKNVVDYEEPAFMRRRRAAAGGREAAFDHFAQSAVDETDLDVPTFLRHKAD